MKIERLVLSITAASAMAFGTFVGSRAAHADPSSFSVASALSKSLPASAVTAADKSTTRGVVSANGKTLTFRTKSIRLVVHTGPDSDMLSYRIAGLRNPMIAIPAGATIRLLLINEDEDMKHNLRFGAVKPPFARSPELSGTVGTPELGPQKNGVRRGEEFVLHAPATRGTFHYLCTVPGHAKGGMYGLITTQ